MPQMIRSGMVLRTGLALTELSLEDFWLYYFSLCGNRSRSDLRAYLAGEIAWPAHEHDVAAQALNECCLAAHLNGPVPLADEIIWVADEQG